MSYFKVDIEREYNKKLKKSLCMASHSSSLSLCINYMKQWFLNKFKDDYFKTIYIDGRHILDETRRLSDLQQLKRLKPSLAIVPSIDLNFDNEKLNLHQFGLDTYSPMGKFKNSFFKDYKNNVFLGIGLEVNLINFTFKVRLNTKSQEIDIFKYMKSAFRVGFTQGEEIDMDFVVPYELMMQLAIDLGFEIRNDRVVDADEFISYLNAHSEMPFSYHLRCLKGREEYFMKMPEMYIHIKSSDISADDGEQEGQLQTNFIIELNTEVRFPSIMFFSYYSETDHTILSRGSNIDDESNLTKILTIKLPNIPKINSKGWSQYIITDYEENELSDNLIIDFNGLFEGDLLNAINYVKEINISPSIFIDIVVYNNGDIITSSIDWTTLKLESIYPVTKLISNIVIYIDNKYMNDITTNIKIRNSEK